MIQIERNFGSFSANFFTLHKTLCLKIGVSVYQFLQLIGIKIQSCKKRSNFLRAKFSKVANLPQNVVKLGFTN